MTPQDEAGRDAVAALAWLRSRTTQTESGCWEVGRAGNYGSIFYKQKKWRAHRAAWDAVNGPIPDGLLVCHRCNNRACVNPAHLYLGTHETNIRDAWRDGLMQGACRQNAAKTHCARGHEFSGDNLIIRPTGYRTCRTCMSQDSAAAWRRKRDANRAARAAQGANNEL